MQRTAQINNEGIGLGLNIVKQMVENQNGELSAYSAGVDRGSTFFVTLMIEPVIGPKSELLSSSSYVQQSDLNKSRDFELNASL